MSSVLERTLGILELLSQQGQGVELAVLAEQLNMPKSAAHRLLADLVRCGYVRQTREMGEYVLTTKLVSMGLTYLSKSGVVDVAQPLIDRLAEQTGELVRLSVVDGDRLTWVARAQCCPCPGHSAAPAGRLARAPPRSGGRHRPPTGAPARPRLRPGG